MAVGHASTLRAGLDAGRSAARGTLPAGWRDAASDRPGRGCPSAVTGLPLRRGRDHLAAADCSDPFEAGREGDASTRINPTAATAAPVANAMLLVVAHVTPLCAASRPS